MAFASIKRNRSYRVRAALAVAAAGVTVLAGPSAAAAPAARIQMVTVPVVIGRPADLVVSTSGGDVVDVAWSFGDGATGGGSNTTHTWRATGTFPVTATVRFADGTTVPTATDVVVLPPPPGTPSARFTWDLGGPSATVVAQPAPGGPVTSWNLGVAGSRYGDERPHGFGVWYVEHHDCRRYVYTLTARGPGGSASWTSPPIGRCAVPGVPGHLTASVSGPRGARLLSLNWTPADADDRLVVDSYTVTVDPGGGQVTPTGIGPGVTVPMPPAVPCGSEARIGVRAANRAGSGPVATTAVLNVC